MVEGLVPDVPVGVIVKAATEGGGFVTSLGGGNAMGWDGRDDGIGVIVLCDCGGVDDGSGNVGCG